MRNKKLWACCMALLCLQKAIEPTTAVFAETVSEEKVIIEALPEAEEPEITEVLPEMEAAEVVEILPEAEEAEAVEVLPEIEEPEAVEVLPEIEDPEAVEVLPEAEEPEAVEVLPEIEDPEAVEVLPEAEEPEAVEVLPEAEKPEAVEVLPEAEKPEAVEVLPEAEEPEVVEVLPEEEESPTVPPKIELLNLSSSTASTDMIMPEIAVEGNDINPESVCVTLKNSDGKTVDTAVHLVEMDGKLVYKMDEIKEDGRYTLIVNSEDAHGNTVRRICTFTVNQEGSVFEHDNIVEEICQESEYSPCIRVMNYDDVKIISCMVNGKEAEYSWDGEYITIQSSCIRYGKNTVTLETKDGAGNISSMEPWEFMVKERGREEKSPTEDGIKTKNFLFHERILNIFFIFGKKLLSI